MKTSNMHVNFNWKKNSNTFYREYQTGVNNLKSNCPASQSAQVKIFFQAGKESVFIFIYIF